ncbi:hypothetical protein FACS1894199_05920 [Bacteroidia bacterium]|nr:hypothetical protein FACS1894199_05920 [Bacteroidia bacterium]
MKKSYFLLGLVVLAYLAHAYSCANKGYPEGGQKDAEAPFIVREVPPSYATGFKKEHIDIYFNEYMALKGVTEKFVISPPMSKKPKVNLRGKYVRVVFQDSLRTDATYSLDFGTSLVDNNEGNPLGYYRYVFATGDIIDTLELRGVVVDAQTNLPIYNMGVFLYDNPTDSVPLKTVASYMAMTDSAGIFRVTNICEKDFRVVAIKDDNRDYKYTPEAEKFAFWDTLVRPQLIHLTRTDTLENDSIIVQDYYGYGPTNIYLRMFEEKPTQLYMLSEERPQRELLRFIFSIPAANDLTIRLLGDSDSLHYDRNSLHYDRDSLHYETDSLTAGYAQKYIWERSAGQDTVQVWIKDSSIYKRDSLLFALRYLRSDTTKQYSYHYDTIRLMFSEKVKKPTKKKKKKDEEEEKVEYPFLEFETQKDASQDVNRGISFVFAKPIIIDSIKNIRLQEKVDTLYVPTEFECKQDEKHHRVVRLTKKWKPEGEYRLLLDSAAITSIYGFHNNSFARKFKVKSNDDYGKVILHLTGVEVPTIVQLYAYVELKPGAEFKGLKILQEIVTDKNGQIVFDYLNPAKYGVRAILDANGNGVWDTGLYLEKRQPEEIVYLKGELEVKKNFDVEQDFDVSSYLHRVVDTESDTE